MDSIPSIKTPERVFLAYGTLVRTSTSTTTPEDINQGLTELYVLNRAMTHWDGRVPQLLNKICVSTHFSDLAALVQQPYTLSPQ